MFSYLLLCSHFDQELLKLVKNFLLSFLMSDLVGKLE